MNETNPFPPVDPQRSASRRHAQGSAAWTLLLVGDHGEVHSVSRFKGLAITVCAGLIATVAALALLGVFYVGLQRENADLRRKLTETHQELSALRGENTILLPYTAALDAVPTDSASPAAAGSTEPLAADTAKVLSHGSSPDPVADVGDPGPASGDLDPSSLTIDDFSARLVDASQTLAVQFTLKNTGSSTSSVSGFVAVILKDNTKEPTAWISIPTMDLSAGRPSGEKKGYPFSIANYKVMRFKTPGVAVPERFQSATIFVYDAHGTALFEMDFPVDLTQQRE